MQLQAETSAAPTRQDLIVAPLARSGTAAVAAGEVEGAEDGAASRLDTRVLPTRHVRVTNFSLSGAGETATNGVGGAITAVDVDVAAV